MPLLPVDRRALPDQQVRPAQRRQGPLAARRVPVPPQRFIAVAGETMSILEIAKVLRRELGSAARRVPRFQAPDWVVRLAARHNPMLRYALPMLGKVRRATSAKARQVLGWTPRGNEEMILATAESLIRLGFCDGGWTIW